MTPAAADSPGGTAIRVSGVILAISCVLLAGTVIDAAHIGRAQWAHALLWTTATLTAACAVAAFRTEIWKRANVWVLACGCFIVLVVIQGLFHDVAVRSVPPLTRVNVATTTAATWSHQNKTFTAYYLLFPLMCFAHYMLQKRLSRRVWGHILAATVTVSSLVLWVPELVPELGQHVAPGGRFRGLATSSNSFGLVGYLTLPWLVTGVLERRRPLMRIMYATSLLLLVLGVYSTGSRTAAGLWVGYILVAPLVVASARLRRRRWLRVVVVLLPLMLGGIVVMTLLPRLDHSTGTLARRAFEVRQRMDEEGLQGVFFRQEARGLHALVALAMVRRAPLAGWGPGGFYREFSNGVFLAVGRLRHATDSALNHYLMIGADLGLPALAVNLFVIMAPLLLGFRLLRRVQDSSDRRMIQLTLTSHLLFLLAINLMPPSYFPDVLWLWTGSLGFLVVWAERQGLLTFPWNRRSWVLLSIIGLLLLAPCGAGAYHVTFGSLGYHARQVSDWWPWRYGRDCYEVEVWRQGPGCWCGNDAVLQIPFLGRPPDTLEIQIASYYPRIVETPVVVKYGGHEGTTEKVELHSSSWEVLRIPASGDYLYSPTASPECRRWRIPWIPQTVRSLAPQEVWYVVLSLRVSRTWQAAAATEGAESRELAVAVLFPEWQPGRGCHHIEQWKEGIGCWCGPDAVVQVPITEEPPDSVDVLLGAFHPDIPGNPLAVEYGGWQGPTERIVINDLAWRTVRVPVSGDYVYRPNAMRDGIWWHLLSVPRRDNLKLNQGPPGRGWFVLSLKTSRGWIPREWGSGDDGRNLGVAVLLPDL